MDCKKAASMYKGWEKPQRRGHRRRRRNYLELDGGIQPEDVNQMIFGRSELEMYHYFIITPPYSPGLQA